MPRRGKTLEKLVHTLEAMFADSTVKVTSPDYVVGGMSGRTREIDITIRGRVGSVTVFVMIECRDRAQKPGIDWIEQLASKRLDIGADRAIAVATAPFSVGARKAAARLSIELRRVEEVSDPSCFPFLGELHALFFVNQSGLHSVALTCRDAQTSQTTVITLSADDVNPDQWICILPDGGQGSLYRPLRRLLDDPECSVWRDVPIGDSWAPRTIELQSQPAGSISVLHEGRPWVVVSAEYSVGLRIKMVQAASGSVKAYFDGHGDLVAGGQSFVGTGENSDLNTDVTWTADGKRYWQRMSTVPTPKRK